MIQVTGRNGESIVYDGTYVSKFRHHGKDEAAKNPASTYRQCSVKPKKRKGDAEQEYEVLLAMSSFMSLTVGEADKPQLDALVAALEARAAG
jgi:hypothetical protein